ncbi:MAG TPA: FHA domain-containing protein [Myxococcaceae bacterium]|nr:FHA domain-containing protein [Myxococcaceae bacterium]
MKRSASESDLSSRSRRPAIDYTLLDVDPISPAFVYVERGPGEGQLIPLGQRALTIGRGVECDLQILDTQVSWQHAKLLRHGTRFFLWDVESTNGTFVNEKRIPEGSPSEVHFGDDITVGPCTFRLRGGAQQVLEVHVDSRTDAGPKALTSLWRVALLAGTVFALAATVA